MFTTQARAYQIVSQARSKLKRAQTQAANLLEQARKRGRVLVSKANGDLKAARRQQVTLVEMAKERGTALVAEARRAVQLAQARVVQPVVQWLALRRMAILEVVKMRIAMLVGLMHRFLVDPKRMGIGGRYVRRRVSKPRRTVRKSSPRRRVVRPAPRPAPRRAPAHRPAPRPAAAAPRPKPRPKPASRPAPKPRRPTVPKPASKPVQRDSDAQRRANERRQAEAASRARAQAEARRKAAADAQRKEQIARQVAQMKAKQEAEAQRKAAAQASAARWNAHVEAHKKERGAQVQVGLTPTPKPSSVVVQRPAMVSQQISNMLPAEDKKAAANGSHTPATAKDSTVQPTMTSSSKPAYVSSELRDRLPEDDRQAMGKDNGSKSSSSATKITAESTPSIKKSTATNNQQQPAATVQVPSITNKNTSAPTVFASDLSDAEVRAQIAAVGGNPNMEIKQARAIIHNARIAARVRAMQTDQERKLQEAQKEEQERLQHAIQNLSTLFSKFPENELQAGLGSSTQPQQSRESKITSKLSGLLRWLLPSDYLAAKGQYDKLKAPSVETMEKVAQVPKFVHKPRPTSSVYVPTDTSWKQQDMAGVERAKDMVTATNEISRWQQPVVKVLAVLADSLQSIADQDRNPRTAAFHNNFKNSFQDGIQAWGNIFDMWKETVSYTTSAIAERRWADARRGATGLAKEGEALAGYSFLALGQLAWSVVSTPIRLITHDIPEFVRAIKERMEGKDRGWDIVFTGANLSGDLIGTYALAKPTGIVDKVNSAGADNLGIGIVERVYRYGDVEYVYRFNPYKKTALGYLEDLKRVSTSEFNLLNAPDEVYQYSSIQRDFNRDIARARIVPEYFSDPRLDKTRAFSMIEHKFFAKLQVMFPDWWNTSLGTRWKAIINGVLPSRKWR